MSKSDIDQLASFLAHRGYREVEKTIFIGQPHNGWESWISYNYISAQYERIVCGWRSQEFIDIMYHAKKFAFESKFNLITKSPFELPMFMACTDDLPQSVGSQYDITIKNQNKGSIDWAILSITEVIEPFLSMCRGYEECLSNLETFSRGLPMYNLTKSVLLKILRRESEFNRFTEGWIGSMRGSSSVIDMHRKFISVLSNTP